MHDAQFAAAARPARFVILGLPMKPYSIGHELILLEKRNALLYQGFEKLPDELKNAAIIQAALVCSQGWLANQKPHRWLKLWQWLNRRPDYAKAISDFQNYRVQGSAFPNTPDPEADMIANGEPEKKGRELGGPYLVRLYNFLCGFPESEIRLHGETVFDFPMGLANFLYITHLEYRGDLKIENRKEEEIKAEMAEHRAFFAKQNKEAECQH